MTAAPPVPIPTARALSCHVGAPNPPVSCGGNALVPPLSPPTPPFGWPESIVVGSPDPIAPPAPAAGGTPRTPRNTSSPTTRMGEVAEPASVAELFEPPPPDPLVEPVPPPLPVVEPGLLVAAWIRTVPPATDVVKRRVSAARNEMRWVPAGSVVRYVKRTPLL